MIVLVFIVACFVQAAALWLAGKLTRVDADFRALLVISGLVTAASFTPVVGGLLAFVGLFVLLNRFCGVDPWPDGLLMVIVSRFVVSGVVMMVP